MLAKIYSQWEQNKNCKGYDYYERLANNLNKNSGWVYNITKNWTKFFDNKANAIISAPKSTFLC